MVLHGAAWCCMVQHDMSGWSWGFPGQGSEGVGASGCWWCGMAWQFVIPHEIENLASWPKYCTLQFLLIWAFSWFCSLLAFYRERHRLNPISDVTPMPPQLSARSCSLNEMRRSLRHRGYWVSLGPLKWDPFETPSLPFWCAIYSNNCYIHLLNLKPRSS